MLPFWWYLPSVKERQKRDKEFVSGVATGVARTLEAAHEESRKTAQASGPWQCWDGEWLGSHGLDHLPCVIRLVWQDHWISWFCWL